MPLRRRGPCEERPRSSGERLRRPHRLRVGPGHHRCGGAAAIQRHRAAQCRDPCRAQLTAAVGTIHRDCSCKERPPRRTEAGRLESGGQLGRHCALVPAEVDHRDRARRRRRRCRGGRARIGRARRELRRQAAHAAAGTGPESLLSGGLGCRVDCRHFFKMHRGRGGEAGLADGCLARARGRRRALNTPHQAAQRSKLATRATATPHRGLKPEARNQNAEARSQNARSSGRGLFLVPRPHTADG